MPLRAFTPERQQQTVDIAKHTKPFFGNDMTVSHKTISVSKSESQGSTRVKWTWCFFPIVLVTLIGGQSSEPFIKYTEIECFHCRIKNCDKQINFKQDKQLFQIRNSLRTKCKTWRCTELHLGTDMILSQRGWTAVPKTWLRFSTGMETRGPPTLLRSLFGF